MIFEWKDFVDIARYLNDAGGKSLPDEAAYRSAVNRAYYGAYGHSTDYAIKCFRFIQCEDGRDHSRLRSSFKNEGKNNPGMMQIALKLKELHKWRKDCDYHFIMRDPKPPDQMATDAIDDAQEIINILI